MKQVILFFLLNKLNMKLGMLLFIFHYYELTHYIMKYFIISDTVFTFLYDLPEHIFETHHIERCLFELKLHYFHHHHYEMLYSATFIRHLAHGLFDLLQLFLKNHSAYVNRRILLKWLCEGLLEILLTIVECNAQGLLRCDESFESWLILLLFFLQISFNLVQLFLLGFAH